MKKILIAFLVSLLLTLTAFALNINTATPKELAHLKGIGKGIAHRIVTERETNGAFKDFKDLSKRVRGIGKKRVATLKEQGATIDLADSSETPAAASGDGAD